jgi:hypothetical protein
MHAVDSAQRPEMQNHNVTAQFFDADWVIAIDPVKAFRKVGRSYFATI